VQEQVADIFHALSSGLTNGYKIKKENFHLTGTFHHFRTTKKNPKNQVGETEPSQIQQGRVTKILVKISSSRTRNSEKKRESNSCRVIINAKFH